MKKVKVLEKQVVDFETGEISSITQTYLVKQNNETFVMGRTTDGDEWIFGLNALEIQLLFVLCTHKVHKSNLISITKGFIKELSVKANKAEMTIELCLVELRKKNLIKQVRKGDYLINPITFYTGGSKVWFTIFDEYNSVKDIKY
jgi:hypothetical protein